MDKLFYDVRGVNLSEDSEVTYNPPVDGRNSREKWKKKPKTFLKGFDTTITVTHTPNT